jgi:hypothetical protein
MNTRELPQNHTGTLGFPKLGDDIVTDLVKVIPLNDHSTCVAIYQNSVPIQSFKRARVDRDLLHPVEEQGGHAPKGPITTYGNGDHAESTHAKKKSRACQKASNNPTSTQREVYPKASRVRPKRTTPCPEN